MIGYDAQPKSDMIIIQDITLQSQAGIEAGLQVKTIWSNINSGYLAICLSTAPCPLPPLPDRNTHTWVQKMIHIGGRSILL